MVYTGDFPAAFFRNETLRLTYNTNCVFFCYFAQDIHSHRKRRDDLDRVSESSCVELMYGTNVQTGRRTEYSIFEQSVRERIRLSRGCCSCQLSNSEDADSEAHRNRIANAIVNILYSFISTIWHRPSTIPLMVDVLTFVDAPDLELRLSVKPTRYQLM